MPEQPRIAFFLADRRHPVQPGDPLWNRHLPSTPSAAASPAERPLTYGQYFAALAAFLSHRHWLPVRRAMGTAARGRRIQTPARVDLFLEKHGAFYHPARVAVATGGGVHEMAANVAVSRAGAALLAGEADLLRRLQERFGRGRLPTVYHCRAVRLKTGRRVPIFLAEWFGGFFEFHLTGAGQGGDRLAVWTPAGVRYPDGPQADALYREAAGLLTDYYDVLSTEQILDWHHAAGDFIVRLPADGRVEVRLVTARRYGPLMGVVASDLGAVLFGAALFLIHTSLRMRMDRRDGVGQPVLAGPETIPATVEGFFQALARKAAKGEIPGDLAAAVAASLAALEDADLAAMMAACIEKRPAGDPERRLLARAAGEHAAVLRRSLAEAGRLGVFHYIQR